MKTEIRNSEERSDSIDGNGTRPTASRAAAPWRGAKRLAPSPDAKRREERRGARRSSRRFASGDGSESLRSPPGEPLRGSAVGRVPVAVDRVASLL
ncbi:hypothetical protein [Rhodococcus erythropolis]|uniref:hypothetical protein n=1 Tax=Rhodococcus erythropolis TaxID=1833 RepID=UPI003917DFA8